MKEREAITAIKLLEELSKIEHEYAGKIRCTLDELLRNGTQLSKENIFDLYSMMGTCLKHEKHSSEKANEMKQLYFQWTTQEDTADDDALMGE